VSVLHVTSAVSGLGFGLGLLAYFYILSFHLLYLSIYLSSHMTQEKQFQLFPPPNVIN